MQKESQLRQVAKTASILGLAGKLVKPAASFLGMHALFNAGIPAAVEASAAKGPIKAKIGSGIRSFAKSFFSPRNLAHSVVSYNVMPTVGAKAIGRIGKTMTKLNPGSRFGKTLMGMDRTLKTSMSPFQAYALGHGAGFIPSAVIGSTVGEKVGGALTQTGSRAKMKDWILGKGMPIGQ